MLLAERSISATAGLAFEQLLLAERRKATFDLGNFGGDQEWRILLVLFVAGDGGYQLAPDIFPMIGIADEATTADHVRALTEQALIKDVNDALELTAMAMEMLRAVLDPTYVRSAPDGGQQDQAPAVGHQHD